MAGTTAAAGPVPAPAWRRPQLAAALAVSVALHAALVLGVRAGPGEGAAAVARSSLLQAQLVAVTDGLLAQQRPEVGVSAPVASASVPAAATAPAPSQAARTSGSGSLSLDLLKVRQYYLASRVHKPPQLQQRADFVYPEGVQASEGMVVARVLIGEDGRVDGVAIEDSRPAGVYDAASIDALLQWRFSPGILHGRAVPTQIMMEVRFSASGGVPPAFAQLLSNP